MTLEVDMQIRKATVADLTTRMSHRRSTFYDMDFYDKAAPDAIEVAVRSRNVSRQGFERMLAIERRTKVRTPRQIAIAAILIWTATSTSSQLEVQLNGSRRGRSIMYGNAKVMSDRSLQFSLNSLQSIAGRPAAT